MNGDIAFQYNKYHLTWTETFSSMKKTNTLLYFGDKSCAYVDDSRIWYAIMIIVVVTSFEVFSFNETDNVGVSHLAS